MECIPYNRGQVVDRDTLLLRGVVRRLGRLDSRSESMPSLPVAGVVGGPRLSIATASTGHENFALYIVDAGKTQVSH